MSVRVTALIAAVLGGLCWVARWGADLAGNGPGWGEAAHWAGLVLLGLAVAVVGAGLVSRSATWLRLIVGIAVPLLVWSVYAVIKGESDAIALDGVLGILAVVLAVLLMLAGGSSPEREDPHRRGHGSHSAR